MDDSKQYSNKMIESFIAKPEKTLWYQNAFSKFNVNGVDAMKWHWSWWAFGGRALDLFRLQRLQSQARRNRIQNTGRGQTR